MLSFLIFCEHFVNILEAISIKVRLVGKHWLLKNHALKIRKLTYGFTEVRPFEAMTQTKLDFFPLRSVAYSTTHRSPCGPATTRTRLL